METNDVLRSGDRLLRVLVVKGADCLCIDCNAACMPFWEPISRLAGSTPEIAPWLDTELTA